MNSQIDFAQHLSKQIAFLAQSCQSYDSGFLHEGVRIATVIRVLIHQTKNSTSLLRHLNAFDIKLLSTVAACNPHAIMFHGMGRTTLGHNGGLYKPVVSGPGYQEMLPVGDWWNQIVFVLGSVKATRKDIVLAAANKDGGAHVDDKLTPEYKTLAASGVSGFFYYPSSEDGGKFKPIMDAHLVYIRQMGYELLNSPDLLNLTGQGHRA